MTTEDTDRQEEQYDPHAGVKRSNARKAEIEGILTRLEKDLPLGGRPQLPWCDTHADDLKALIAAHGNLDVFAEISGIKRSTVLRWLRSSELGHRAVVPEHEGIKIVHSSDSDFWRGKYEGVLEALKVVCGE